MNMMLDEVEREGKQNPDAMRELDSNKNLRSMLNNLDNTEM